ncbi:hypothetical protein EDC96DRAFT_573718 [Choanephora cucurbitarum]|nr:hypothetical protein EDC96DRAFT_573718 [Choanephora cucurbitarum]
MSHLGLSARAPVLSNNVCNTTACIATSEYILSRVDLTVDPCSDFYQYTCGGWLNSPAVKENYAKGILTRESESRLAKNKLKETEILEGTYEDFKRRIKSNATGFHLDDQAELDRSNFELFKSHYDVCKDVNLYHINRFTPIFEDIVMLQKEIIPLNATASQYGRAMAFFLQQSISILPFQMSVTISFSEHNIRQVLIGGSPAFAKYIYDRETIVSRLAQVIGQPGADDSNAHTVKEASQRSGLELWSNSAISTAVDNHQKIVGLIGSIYNKFASNLTYDVTSVTNGPWISFDTVQQALPKIDMRALLKTLWRDIEEDAVGGLHFRTFPPFLKEINDMLSTESEKSVQDFFIVQYIVDKYDHLAPIYLRELLSNITSEQRNLTVSNDTAASMQLYCSRDTNAHFVYGLTRYFGLETFGDENDRQEVLRFIETVREALLTHISSNDWLDDQTKQFAINKMKMTKADAAYSVTDPDMRDPASIKRYYGNQKSDDRSFYHAKKAALLGTSERMWKALSPDFVLEIWYILDSPGTINAFHWPHINSIGILPGFLQKPSYSTDIPKYINFGAAGSTIGHEFVHGLDTKGKYFNGTGHIENRWSPQATKEYEERQKCFVGDYSKIFIMDEQGNKVFVNGQQTLNENIADIGGLSIAFDAYRNYIDKERQGQPEPSLPGLEHLSSEQMLYISYSLSKCEAIPPNQARFYATDEHAPNFARVNPVTQNNANFATVFNCPVDSPMNKKDKCHLW